MYDSTVSKEFPMLASPRLYPGWQDWVIFHQLGYFWKLIVIFWKDEVAQNNGNFLGYFLFKQIYYIFT
jgi:hypothetical protein